MKNLPRIPLAVVLFACLALVAVSCSPKDENTVVGKWSVDNETKVTFTKEGKIINDEKGSITTGDYAFTDGKLLSVKMPDMGTNNIDFDVIFSNDKEMVLTMRMPKNLPAGMPIPKIEPQKFTRLTN